MEIAEAAGGLLPRDRAHEWMRSRGSWIEEGGGGGWRLTWTPRASENSLARSREVERWKNPVKNRESRVSVTILCSAWRQPERHRTVRDKRCSRKQRPLGTRGCQAGRRPAHFDCRSVRRDGEGSSVRVIASRRRFRYIRPW